MYVGTYIYNFIAPITARIYLNIVHVFPTVTSKELTFYYGEMKGKKIINFVRFY